MCKWRCGFHTLRHTYASHLVNKGVPLLTIKDLLGHTDIKTTTIYAHLSNEHLQNAAKQIDYKLNTNADYGENISNQAPAILL
ncbi:MAG: tyrosine-type recombinase/integrase [Candidatus Saganbacteria bacterium]|nr:tyrosine-type recombinase/integrase [Candidatus Saganbacteria bacterium]